MLFAEQFAAAAYGIGLALTFLRFRWRKTHQEETGYAGAAGPAPGYDWALAALSLALCGYLAVKFPHLTAMAGTINAEHLSLIHI